MVVCGEPGTHANVAEIQGFFERRERFSILSQSRLNGSQFLKPAR
jgi:hypothetical protein